MWVVPEKVYQATKDIGRTWDQLTIRGNANKAKWSDEQLKDLDLLAQAIMSLYSAVKNLIDANDH